MAAIKTPETTPAPAADAPTSNPWANKWTIASAVLVAVLVLAAVWIAVTRPDPDTPRQPQSSAVPTPAVDGCGPAPAAQTPPITAPATTWTLLGGMAAPTSDAAGPTQTSDGVPVCFAGDPVGALFAASTFLAASTDPDLRLPVIEHMAAAGPGKDAALTQSQQSPGTRTVGVQIAGFAYLAYTPATTAIIDLALSSKGQFLHVPLQLIYLAGDWRVELPVTGRPFDSIATLPSLAGFVPWQGA